MNTFTNRPPEFDFKKMRPIILLVAIVLFFIIFGAKMFVTIDSGHAGILYKPFADGVDTEFTYGQGFHWIAPWNHMIVYETRQKEVKENMTILSSNLLEVSLDVSILYEPVFEDLGKLEVEKGSSYEEKIVRPMVRSIVRRIMGKYLPEEINTTKREEIELMIKEQCSEQLASTYLQLNNILIRNITLPNKLRESIERKLQQEQESLEYEYRLEKESKEAQRKRIEAKGIEDFQNIVNKSITKELLKWKGIEATLDLAKSPNAKVVVVGGDDGLPIILGGNN